MQNNQDQAAHQPPLVCTLSEAEKAERRDEFGGLFTQVAQLQELADGYAFRFAGDEALLPRLLEFIHAERACCQFFTFELAFEPELGPIWLRLRGAEGVKEIVASWSWVSSLLQRQQRPAAARV
jgi:hypothetical protein